MTDELTVIENQDLALNRDPDVVLAEATKAAQALKRVIDNKPKKVIINNETYLEFEDWQTVARFYGLSARVVHTAMVEIGEVRGYEAHAEVWHIAGGKMVSSAESMCLNDEERWQSRPLFQLRSMAQTRACAKALRNCLAWVVVLAGYRPTPAEEIIDKETEHKGEYWCEEHEVFWFKKGRMKGYAHPIGDTKEWCNMPVETEDETPTPIQPDKGEALDPKAERDRLEAELKAALLEQGIDSQGVPMWLFKNFNIRDIKKTTAEEFMAALLSLRSKQGEANPAP